MTAILLIAGFVAFLYLQGRLKTLERRLLQLEADGFVPVATPAPWQAPAESQPAAETQEAEAAPPVPEPELALAIPSVEEPAPLEMLPSPEADLETAEQPRPPRLTFEDLFGRKLPIWAGGVTLAIAGFLIVKYSIDTGLLSPAIRVFFGMLFGFALIGGAEAARRQAERVRDPRVAQALAGAGVATLYGSVVIAGNLYGLIEPGAAFVGLAAVTALALVLAPRFGAPSALLGLVGGFAAPLFVGSDEPNVPLLTIYLGLTVGGLAAIARTQRWPWLGHAAMAGGFVWSAALIASSPLSPSTSMSLGLFVLLLGLALPLQAIKGFSPARSAIGAAVAALQVAAMVARGGFAPLDWALFALLSIGLQWLARRDPALNAMRAVGFGIALLLLAAWLAPPERDFGVALAAMLLIYGGPALYDLWRTRGGLIEAGQLCAAALAVWLLPFLHFHEVVGSDRLFGLLALTGCVMAGGVAALGWRNEARGADLRLPLLVGTASISAITAAAFLAPMWLFAPLVGAIACLVLTVALLAEDVRIEGIAWAGLIVALASALFLPVHWPALVHAAGGPEWSGWRPIASLTMVFAAATAFARLGRIAALRAAAQAVAALLGYAVLAQFSAVDFLPMLAGGLIAVLAVAGVDAARPFVPALAALGAVALLWSVEPAVRWFAEALRSVAGLPLLVTELPPVRDALLRLAVPGAAIGIAGSIALRRERPWALGIAGTLLMVAMHIGYKQLFAIGDAAAFEWLGLAERTVWEAVLLGAGLLLMRWNERAGLVTLGLGLAHFAWYTVMLHNPLWWPQAVGTMPLLNLLLPVYGLPLIALFLAAPAMERQLPGAERAVRIARMVLILLLGWSLLRQAFHGNLLVGCVSDTEDIARSIAIVGAGVGFLLWGIVRGGRDWRLASLVLMLAAAGKVFLLDAAGLDGLARIGAFVALGFSLIGIGWLYARFVGKPALTAQP